MPPIIDLDDHRFYRLVTLSNKLAAPVLRRVIKQYCDVHGLTFEEVLNLYKHELFHYCHGATAGCCKCNGRRFTRVFLDKQWNALFTDISSSLLATHAHYGHDAKGCQRLSVLDLGSMSMYVTFYGFFYINQYNRENNYYPSGWSYDKNFDINSFEHQWTVRVHHRPTLITSRCERL